jgi:hypothetical protein
METGKGTYLQSIYTEPGDVKFLSIAEFAELQNCGI